MSGSADTMPGALFVPGLRVFSDEAETAPLDAEMRRRVLEEFNRTGAPFPAGVCMHHLFEAQAARTPHAVAAVCEQRSLTYAELNEAANRLAHYLRRLGVRPEVRVGIGFRRGLEMLVSILAVLKAGGAYVPLDSAYPAERLEFTLRDARVAVLLTQDSVRDQFPLPEGVRVVSVDAAADEIARESAANPAGGATSRNLGYLIYTSGSTGVPKGVAIEHESAVVLLAWAADLHTAEELGGMLASTSICFDLSIYELFLPLSLGGRVIIVDNALALPSAPAADQVRLINSVPSAAYALIKTGGIPAGVTTVNLAGEPLRTELVDALYAHGVRRVFDLYGPSEDTTYSTYTLRRAGAPATIGRPISNTQAYVLDERMQPVAVGVIGELYLAGLGLARGYLGRPGLTADRFIPDPFGGVPGGRMYRTGDRVRWTDAGNLEYLGRLDHQVKIRGFRVELGEIESTLRRFAGVRDCVVMAREDVPGEKYLAAYLVGDAEHAALRAHLRATLPEHFVPAAFVTLDEMPLTPNGKLDRKALPAPEFTASAEAYLAPRTPVEEVLAGAWAEVLGLERVGVRDNVYDLGAQSLLATRVVARAAEAFGVELTVRAVFEAPTVEALAQRVEAAREAGRPALPPIVPLPRTGEAPLSFGQKRLWYLDRVEPGKAAYNVAGVARLSGALDVAVLERALGEIVRRHEALRTVFQARDGAAVQVIAPFAGLSLPVEDLGSLDADAREAGAERRILEEAALPFDLAAGPLFRPGLLRLADDEHVLLLTVHHALSDGWSMDVLYRELGELYTAFADGRESPLAEPALQYGDYAAWQQAHLGGEWLREELGWWKERLAGAPALLELPTDHARPAVQTYAGARETVGFPAELAERLEALARREGASLYMVLMAAWQVLLGRYAGMDDVVVGSPIAGRTRREVQDVIGFFTNTLVLRTDLSGDPRFSEVLRRVREVTLGAYEHQDVPLEQVVRAVAPGRSLSHAPLFQVMFVMQTGGPGPRMPAIEARVSETHPGTAKLDLTLSLTREADGLGGYLEYGTDLFQGATVRRMVAHLHTLLEQVAADADLPLSRVRLLNEAERAVVVHEWNATDAAYPADACIHTPFEAQAARTPDAPAVVHGDEALSYAELDARANRLANHLVRMGIGPEVRVAVCLEPSPEMIVSVLGVLKAGGAYVPLDPGSPVDRLRMMLADAGVAAVLTQESLRATLPVPDGVGVLSVDGAAAEIAAESAHRPACGAGPRSLAYVIYTSGSTGVPKGVGVEHRGACNLVPELVRILALEPGSRSLLLAPLHFDASVAEIFSALAAGASLHLPESAEAVPGPEMLALLRRDRITHTKFTPSALSALPVAELPDLATLVVGGEACTAELVSRWGGDRRFVNVYGPTEATVRVSAALCMPGEGMPSIGRPLANTRLYVLDAAGEPAPVGVPGELYVGGVQLARGYLGRAALTAASFVPDPFGGEAGARLYRTGDRVRWTSGGTLEYLGRLDHQVKIRGYRIEPGEVDATLRRHPAVRDCAVVMREDVPGDRRLVAYVAGDADADTLRAHLRRGLPEYMVPAAFVAVDALPLTANGKLDRRALPAPDLAAAEDAYVAPRTSVEEVLAGIWAQLLGVERVGVHDDFFRLGGHSLLATRLVWRMGEVFGTEVPVRVVLESSTVARLADRVDAARGAGAA
ncbi:MAG TPA: amino acid adenylation domain-containing protein, partial [Longimicrobium sp.]|nr:amino acid adenylation domain-containing protein [Longimicrobium sp.]